MSSQFVRKVDELAIRLQQKQRAVEHAKIKQLSGSNQLDCLRLSAAENLQDYGNSLCKMERRLQRMLSRSTDLQQVGDFQENKYAEMTNIISEWFRDHEERIALAKQKLRAMHLLTQESIQRNLQTHEQTVRASQARIEQRMKTLQRETDKCKSTATRNQQEVRAQLQGYCLAVRNDNLVNEQTVQDLTHQVQEVYRQAHLRLQTVLSGHRDKLKQKEFCNRRIMDLLLDVL